MFTNFIAPSTRKTFHNHSIDNSKFETSLTSIQTRVQTSTFYISLEKVGEIEK